jgi:hypothetical protein
MSPRDSKSGAFGARVCAAFSLNDVAECAQQAK